MTANAATEGALGSLHGKVAKVMTRALDNIEAAQEAYALTANDEAICPEVSPALLSVITKFLNENKITCTPEESETMSELERTLAEKRTRRRPRKQVGNVVHMDPFADE